MKFYAAARLLNGHDPSLLILGQEGASGGLRFKGSLISSSEFFPRPSGRLCSQFDNICGAEWCLMSATYWVIGTGRGVPGRVEIKRNSLVAGDMEKGMWLSTSFTAPTSKSTGVSPLRASYYTVPVCRSIHFGL